MPTRKALIVFITLLCAASSMPAQVENNSGPVALIILNTDDKTEFHRIRGLIHHHKGDVDLGFPFYALIAHLSKDSEYLLRTDPMVKLIQQSPADSRLLHSSDPNIRSAAESYNYIYWTREAKPESVPKPQREPLGGDVLDSRNRLPDGVKPNSVGPAAPISTQTSEFMAGLVLVNIIYVESNVVAGSPTSTFDPHYYCPYNTGLPTHEQWTTIRKTRIMNEVRQGASFYNDLTGHPEVLDVVVESLGESVIECEPITFPSAAESLWVSDALEGIGYEVTAPNMRELVARTVTNDRRLAIGADWSVIVFVVDSKVDADGLFADGIAGFVKTENGPYMVLTWDNGKAAFTITNFAAPLPG